MNLYHSSVKNNIEERSREQRELWEISGEVNSFEYESTFMDISLREYGEVAKEFNNDSELFYGIPYMSYYHDGPNNIHCKLLCNLPRASSIVDSLYSLSRQRQGDLYAKFT